MRSALLCLAYCCVLAVAFAAAVRRPVIHRKPGVCTAYASKSGCAHYRPVSQFKEPIPACGAFHSSRAGGDSGGRRKQQVFVSVGDFGITDGGCARHVADLVDRLGREFGITKPQTTTGPAPASALHDFESQPAALLESQIRVHRTEASHRSRLDAHRHRLEAAHRNRKLHAPHQVTEPSSAAPASSSHGASLDWIMSTGDNNYWHGNCDSFQSNVEPFYGAYYTPSTLTCLKPDANNAPAIARAISGERQRMMSGAGHRFTERFFPTYGNHDWDKHAKYPHATPYLQYWPYLTALDGGAESAGQYYTHTPFPGLQLFTINSNVGRWNAGAEERDFADQQMQWLQRSLRESTARFKLLFFHHPIHSTAQHDPPADWMDFPYDRWGATAVFTGHQHCYERLVLSSHNHTATVSPTRAPHGLKRAAATNGAAAVAGEFASPWVGHEEIDVHDNDELDTEDTIDEDSTTTTDSPAVPAGRDGIAWITNGIGGHPWLYELHNCDVYPGSRVRYNKYHGAMLGILSTDSTGTGEQTLDMCFYSLENGITRVDHFTL